MDRITQIEAEYDQVRSQLQLRLGQNYPHDDSFEAIQLAIETEFERFREEEKANGLITIDDVNSVASRIQERTLATTHNLIQNTHGKVRMCLRDSAHLITAPAASLHLVERRKNILFSSDRGNPALPPPYPQPDDT